VNHVDEKLTVNVISTHPDNVSSSTFLVIIHNLSITGCDTLVVQIGDWLAPRNS